MTGAAARAADILDRLPIGTFRAQALGRDWLLTRSLFAGGASEKLVGRSLDGADYISLNLYRLETGPRLRPCEMPVAKVMAVLEGLAVPDASRRNTGG
ncbi:MAG: hypothetical protein AAF264_07535 [Pseudomonadota bacterium]